MIEHPPQAVPDACVGAEDGHTGLLQTKRPRDVQPSEVVTANLDERMTMTTRITNWGDPRLSERFWKKCTPEPNTSCWLWHASTDAGGYGQIRIDWKLYTAHILAYRTLVGDYDDGLDLDHKCRNRVCVNPSHLEPVTRAVNLARGIGFHIRKTHCPKGHPYDETNTRVYRGIRYCKACKRKGEYVPRIHWRDRIKAG